ncbi:MAG: hypothetical protein RIB46_20730 [Pseudomonadales bacterium]
MNDPCARQALFWNCVLAAAEALESASAPAAEVSARLLALEEGFAQLADPVESFEAYTVLKLCRALRQRLAELEPPVR